MNTASQQAPTPALAIDFQTRYWWRHLLVALAVDAGFASQPLVFAGFSPGRTRESQS